MTLGVLSCGSLLAFSTLLQAQEFRAPDFSGASTAPAQQGFAQPNSQQPNLLQQKQQHAEALKAQMMRAQREQGAPDGFAQKAFEAQQAYLAELAYEEHQAYQQRQQQQHQYHLAQTQNDQPQQEPEVAQASYLQTARRLPKPSLQRSVNSRQAAASTFRSPAPNRAPQQMSQVPSSQATYSPPVHVTPPGVSMSIGDQPARDRMHGSHGYSQQYQVARLQKREQSVLQYANPKQNAAPKLARQTQPRPYNVVPKSQYQPTRPARQPLYQPAHQAQQVPAYPPAQANPIQRVAAQSRAPQPIQNQNQSARNQPARNHSVQESVFPPVMGAQRVHGPNDPYVLGERPPVGLQDRIASLLSRPKYQEVSKETGERGPRRLARQPVRTAQPPLAVPQRNAANQALAYQNHSRPKTVMVQPPQRASHSSGLINRASAAMASSNRSISNQGQTNGAQKYVQRAASKPRPKSDREVQLAYQMEQRMNQARRPRSSVQQVAMVEPVQDPFNEGRVRFSGGNQPLRPKQPTLSAPATKYPAQAQDVPARQISVLNRGRNQDSDPIQDDNQFGMQNDGLLKMDQDPVADIFSQKTDEELQKIDDELNRRLKELDSKSQEDAMDKPRLDQLADQLDKEIAGQDDPLDSVMDDPADDFNDDPLGADLATKPVEKSCEEFRSELLNSSIRDIALDISPPASSSRDQYMAISRSWTDRTGRVIATGAMVDLRRGYVILETGGGRQKIPYAKLSDADWAAISEYWRIPTLCSVGDRGGAARNWVPQTFTWHASAICHKPLFFENVQLERYGHSHGPFTQPVHSVAHFFVSLVSVPYRTAISPPNECQYALGFYRPGNCAPWLKDPIPISLDGVRRQAVFTTGAAFIP